MYQIDNSSAAAVIPASTPAGTPGYFTDGNPATGVAPTILPAEFMNMVMMEILGVLSAAGVTPSKSSFTQLTTAIRAVGRQATIVADTGATNTYTATNTPALGALPATGYIQRISIAHLNTGASTYAPDGLAAKPVYGLGLQPLQGGELPVGVATLMYLVQAGVNGGNGAWIILESLGGAAQISPGTGSNHAATVGQVQSGYGSFAIDTGTANTYVCSFAPALTGRSEGLVLRFKVKTANSGACTINDGLGVVPLVGGAHAALQGGELVANGDAWVEWNGSVGSGSYILMFCTGAAEQVANAAQSQHAVPLGQVQTLIAAGPSIQGAFKNMTLSATGANASVTIAADEIIVENASNQYQTLRAVSVTASAAGTGANGLDSGAIAASTWYSVWLIWNGTTIASLLSLSATAPTLPSGYTHKARAGWIRTDGTANKYPLSFIQLGRSVQYKVAAGSNLTALLLMANGVAGSTGTPTWVAVGVSNYVPPTASKIKFYGANTSATAGTLIAAPNNAYGAVNASPPPPMVVSNAGTSPNSAYIEMALESTNIYWASSAAPQSLICLGWEDNI
ncbi:hypothetical protein PMI21_01064 [Pseudomonas sp. GM18]|uniref:hypothetical protein n=1 Tax=Pseudomonas sp. GM18 TaxID=1144324 RepID=UPI000272603E|nr:hypothetical protein [Pseudomonas sp. GM18]EJM20162.1 hypothetical protein PMI21_01064 [Pseudomonas sp. GM18]